MSSEELTSEQLDAVEKEWTSFGQCEEHNLDALIRMARRYLAAKDTVRQLEIEAEVMGSRISSDDVLVDDLRSRLAYQDAVIRSVLDAVYQATCDTETRDEATLGARVAAICTRFSAYERVVEEAARWNRRLSPEGRLMIGFSTELQNALAAVAALDKAGE